MTPRDITLMLARALSMIRYEATGALANYLSPDHDHKRAFIRIECRARDALESLKNAAPQEAPAQAPGFVRGPSLESPAVAARHWENNGWRKPTSNEPLWDEEVLVYRVGVMRVALLTSDGWRDADHLEEILEPTWWRRLPEKPQ